MIVGLVGILWLVACSSTDYYSRCLTKCVEWYSKVPYVDDKELWEAIVDNKETTLSFEEWEKDVHTKRDHYAKYQYCPKACKDSDIYMRMGWY